MPHAPVSFRVFLRFRGFANQSYQAPTKEWPILCVKSPFFCRHLKKGSYLRVYKAFMSVEVTLLCVAYRTTNTKHATCDNGTRCDLCLHTPSVSQNSRHCSSYFCFSSYFVFHCTFTGIIQPQASSASRTYPLTFALHYQPIACHLVILIFEGT